MSLFVLFRQSLLQFFRLTHHFIIFRQTYLHWVQSIVQNIINHNIEFININSKSTALLLCIISLALFYVVVDQVFLTLELLRLERKNLRDLRLVFLLRGNRLFSNIVMFLFHCVFFLYRRVFNGFFNDLLLFMLLRHYVQLLLYFLELLHLLGLLPELASAGPEGTWRRDLLHHTHHFIDLLLEVDGLHIMELCFVDSPDFIHQLLLVRDEFVGLREKWLGVGRPQSVCIVLPWVQHLRAAALHKADLIFTKILIAVL